MLADLVWLTLVLQQKQTALQPSTYFISNSATFWYLDIGVQVCERKYCVYVETHHLHQEIRLSSPLKEINIFVKEMSKPTQKEGKESAAF